MPDLNTPNRAGKTIKDYLPMAMQKLMGQQQSRPTDVPTEDPVQQEQARPYGDGKKVIDKKAIEKAIQTLKKYKDGKQNLDTRIIEEERWWGLRHWDVIRGASSAKLKGEEARPEPTSAWLFNSVANKHADMMDNYPEPNVLPRELSDEKDAQTLSSVLPVVFERNEYEQTYSQSAWYKLKHGVSAKGVFWNTERENGLGDVDVRFLDILNIFWEPGITDIQKSRNLFVVDLRDNDLLEQEYPHLKGKLQGKLIEVKQYVHDDTVDVTDKSLIVDWYYKKRTPEGKTILHYCKFVGDHVLYASEDDPEYADRGYYDHGRYPVELDVLYPEEGTPVGFGLIAIMKSPQLYIDKLSQVILENSMMSAKPRFFAKKGMGINEKEFLDWTKPLVHYEGNIDGLQPVQVQQVSGAVLNVLQMKIDELKETSSNRDVSQGSSSGGVTAAAAIAALQEAGNKTSRDMIAATYHSYTQECYLAIELIRQFYDEMRTFRITGKQGGYEYIRYSNASIKGTPIPAAYAGQELEPGYQPATRIPVFDVVVKPQKRSPYSKMAQNELAKEMYQMGLFNPQLAEQAMTALEMMDFDGEEKVKERVQQGQTLMNQLMAVQQQLTELATLVAAERGFPVKGGGSAGKSQPVAQPHKAEGKSMGSAQTDAMGANMTAYGERLAANAKPDMNNA